MYTLRDRLCFPADFINKLMFHIQIRKVLQAVTPEYLVCTASLGLLGFQVVTAAMDATEPKGIGEAQEELDAMDLQVLKVLKENLESRVLPAKRGSVEKVR